MNLFRMHYFGSVMPLFLIASELTLDQVNTKVNFCDPNP